MLTWLWTSPPSSRTRPRSDAYSPSSSSSSPPTVDATLSTRSRLPVARRNGVGMYTVTAMPVLLAETQVTFAGVRQYRHHELIPRQRRRHRAGGERRGAGRDAHQQPFFAGQPPRPRDGVLVAHGDDVVDDVTVQHAGN